MKIRRVGFRAIRQGMIAVGMAATGVAFQVGGCGSTSILQPNCSADGLVFKNGSLIVAGPTCSADLINLGGGNSGNEDDEDDTGFGGGRR